MISSKGSKVHIVVVGTQIHEFDNRLIYVPSFQYVFVYRLQQTTQIYERHYYKSK